MDYQPDNSVVAVLRRAQVPGIRDSKARTLAERNHVAHVGISSHTSLRGGGFTVQAHSSARQEAGKRVGTNVWLLCKLLQVRGPST